MKTDRSPRPAGALRVVALAFGLVIASFDTALAQFTPPRPTAALSGVVRDTLNRPLQFVTVLVAGSDQSTVTDIGGRFRVGGLAPGANAFSVLRIGYESLEFEVELAASQTVDVEITLRPIATLETVETTADRMTRFIATGFEDRRRTGIGAFLTPERVDSLRHLSTPAKMLRDINGIQVRCRGAGTCEVEPRFTGCLQLFVDGQSYGESQIDDVLWSNQIYAMEVYDRASRVPALFQDALPVHGRNVRAGCGAIVVWTEQRAP